MRSNLTLILFMLLISLPVFAQPEVEWTWTIGEEGTEVGNKIIPIDNGNFAIVGCEDSFGNGRRDGWLVVIDREGELLFDQNYGGEGSDTFYNFLVTEENEFYMVGDLGRDFWLVKANEDAEQVFSETYVEEHGHHGYAIAETENGNFILGGYEGYRTVHSADAYVILVNPDGEEIWSRTYGGDEWDLINEIVPTDDGGFLLIGRTHSFGAGDWDIWVLKIDEDGDQIWSRTYGGQSDEMFGSLVQLENGNYLLAIRTQSFNDEDHRYSCWLLELDDEGEVVREDLYDDIEFIYITDMIQSRYGGFILVGSERLEFVNEDGENDYHLDGFVMKLDEEREMSWVETYGVEPTGDGFNSVVQMDDCGFLILGGSNSFGDGDHDIWLVKLGAEPGGIIEGIVLDAVTEEPIVDARVRNSFGQITWTNNQGFYQLNSVSGNLDLIVSKPGYCDLIEADIQLDFGEEIECNLGMLTAEIDVSIEEIEIDLDQDGLIERQITLTNTGSGSYNWWSEHRLPDDSFAESWTSRQTIHAGREVDDSRLYGVVLVEDRFYVAGGGNDPNMIYVLDVEGNQVDQFQQFGRTPFGIFDLAYDGNLIWGGEGPLVYGFDTQGEAISLFWGPYDPNRNIVWDSDRELFWISHTSRDLIGCDSEGEERAVIDNPQLRIYGLAYWQDDPDGFPLHAFVKSADDQQEIYKINPDNGEFQYVTTLEPEEGGNPMGAYITNIYDMYCGWVFINISDADDGDRIDIWQLKANTEFVSMEPAQGDLEPEQEQEVTITVDAQSLRSGEYEFEIVINHHGALEETIIPVTLGINPNNGEDHEMTIRLHQGWNLISINIITGEDFWTREEGPDIIRMMEQLRIDEDNHHIQLMKDEDGLFYIPAWGFNNIPYWNLSESYLVNVDEGIDVVWEGELIDADMEIQLEEGWNMIAYFPLYNLDASVPDFYVLSPIIDNIEIAKNGDGQFMIPEFNFSNMAPWQPGQGYQVNVDEDVEFVYPPEREEELASCGIIPQYSPLASNGENYISTGSNMSLLLNNISGNVQPGDLISVLNSKNEIMSVGIIDKDGRCGLTVWGDDELTDTVDGLMDGEKFRLHLSGGDRQLDIQESEILLGSGLVYGTDELTVINASVQCLIPEQLYLSTPYPNPFNSTTRISYGLPEEADVSILIYDIKGSLVETLVSERQKGGDHSLVWEAGTTSTGLYLIKIKAGHYNRVTKVILTR